MRDAATERFYFRDGNSTTYHYTEVAVAIAAYTEGVSLPTGQQASTALLEIRGAGTISARPASAAMNAITIANSNSHTDSLGQNYPNLFDQEINISFTISKAKKVNLVLFDISGRIVKVLVNASKDAGTHTVNFNAGHLPGEFTVTGCRPVISGM